MGTTRPLSTTALHKGIAARDVLDVVGAQYLGVGEERNRAEEAAAAKLPCTGCANYLYRQIEVKRYIDHWSS